MTNCYHIKHVPNAEIKEKCSFCVGYTLCVFTNFVNCGYDAGTHGVVFITKKCRLAVDEEVVDDGDTTFVRGRMIVDAEVHCTFMQVRMNFMTDSFSV